MGAERKPTILEVACDTDRSDRFAIDGERLIYLLHSDPFFDDIDALRAELNIPTLLLKTDAEDRQIKLHGHRLGVNSKYLNSLPKETFEVIEKEVYKKILCHWYLNSNFYLFVEFYLLYKYLLPPAHFELNPNLYEWYIKYGGKEMIRNSHTDSDIEYLLKYTKIKCGISNKATSEDKKFLDNYKAILKFHQNTERRPKSFNATKNAIVATKLLGKPYAGSTKLTTYDNLAYDNLVDVDKPEQSPDEKKVTKERLCLIKAVKRAKIYQKNYLKN